MEREGGARRRVTWVRMNLHVTECMLPYAGPLCRWLGLHQTQARSFLPVWQRGDRGPDIWASSSVFFRGISSWSGSAAEPSQDAGITGVTAAPRCLATRRAGFFFGGRILRSSDQLYKVQFSLHRGLMVTLKSDFYIMLLLHIMPFTIF